MHARGGYGQAAASGELATRLDRDRGVIVVAAITSGALPAYTLTPGTLGVGDVITANANGAFPTLAGGAKPVAGAANGGDLFLLHHGASATDNRVWKITADGSVGSTWSAIAYDGCDTAAKIVGSKIRVMGGPLEPGGEYVYVGSPTPTVNTTLLFWLNTTPSGVPNEVIRYVSDFEQTVLPTNGTMLLSGQAWLVSFLSGTGTAFALESDNSGTVSGAISAAMGTTASGRAGWLSSWVVSATAANEGFSILCDTNLGLHVEFVCAIPTASNGTKQYKTIIGFINDVSASSGGVQVAPKGIYAEYDSVNSANWAGTTKNTSATTTVGSVAAGTSYVHGVIHKDAGSDTVHFVFGGTEAGTGQSTNVPNGVQLGFVLMGFGSVGTGASVKMLKPDYVAVTVSKPARRYA